MPGIAPVDEDGPQAVDLESEAATFALAKWLAGFARAGDFITLSGDLGSGKTAFARAYLRAVLDDPDLEAPSPTFTLIQAYDAPEFPVVHADFYRLRGPDELLQLGWDETIDGAVTLVEWPERAAAVLPRDRLDVSLTFCASRGASFRRAEFQARGAMAGRFKRARAVEVLLERAGWSRARRAPMYGDASTRAYERLSGPNGETAILMTLPPRPNGPTLRFGKSYAEIARLSPDIRAFLAIGEGLRGLGYSTPRVLARSIVDGLALIEDFGGETVAENEAPNPSRYAEATALLADLHGRELPAELHIDGETYTLPVYDIEAMSIEVELALDWYAPAIARGAPSSGARIQFVGLWREALAPILAKPITWTLRDFHSPNLHWLADREGLKRLGPD